jgi:hypothetical protein
MRATLCSLSLLAAAVAVAPAAPAPLTRRPAPERAVELAAMQKALDRVGAELSGQVQFLAVRRGDAPREWVVTYFQESPNELRRLIEIDGRDSAAREVRFVADTPEQFAQALRAQFAWYGKRFMRCG